MFDSENDLRARVDAFVDDLNVLIREAALLAVHQALGVSGKRGPGRPRGAAKASVGTARAAKGGGKRAKRDPKAVLAMADKVHAAVKAKPGQSVEQIGKALGAPTKALTLPIRKLIEAKRVKTKGQRRGTRYFPG
ncbi:MAG: DNA-binding protein [Planctomycetota bacterium]|nr:MAG: DNA-binding protein [Planctomycetota bacterium]